MSTYITYAIGRMMVDVAISEYGTVTILDQWGMSEQEQEDAVHAGHQFNLAPTVVQRRNYDRRSGVVDGQL